MFDEMSFLFKASSQISNKFNSQKDSSRMDLDESTRVSNTNNPAQSLNNKIEYNEETGEWEFNEYTVTKTSLNNYIESNVNAAYSSTSKNPYLSLLEYFNGIETNPALKLKASDFSYLRDLGVYPINRLMILRRFPEGAVVPVDLNDLPGVEPIATIVGWVKADSELLTFNVNEVWKTQSKWLHDLIREIIQNEFGIDVGGILPIPGWGQGFMFGLLKEMGLTDYSATNLPIGDANLLREGITRAHEEQGLQSSFNFNLETVYEQKYIGGIDAGAAFNDLMSNALTMGTSNIRFLGKPGNRMADLIREANNNPSDPSGWKILIVDLVKTAVSALKGTITSTLNNNSEVFAQDVEKETGDDAQEKRSKESEAAEASVKKIGILQKLISSVLASTVARYQWPIRGALNQLTGEAATPWHLTIGNPYAPLLSINNIKVNTLDVTLGNEMAYNDVPKFMTVKVTIEQGRNFGKQEIENMFNIAYKREYKKI